jgi:hypothetical protein
MLQARTRPTTNNPHERVLRLRNAHAASGANLVLAAWIIVSPWTLGYDSYTSVDINHLVVGVSVLGFALARCLRPLTTTPLSVLNVMLGAWLVASQFVLDYSAIADTTALMWNGVWTGVAVAFFGLWSTIATWRWPQRF